MPPTTPRDFLKVAAQRLTTAETLLREKLTLDAQYLGGYTVECSLKALILHRTPDPDKPEKLKRLTSGAKMHRPDVLLGEVRDLTGETLEEVRSPAVAVVITMRGLLRVHTGDGLFALAQRETARPSPPAHSGRAPEQASP